MPKISTVHCDEETCACTVNRLASAKTLGVYTVVLTFEKKIIFWYLQVFFWVGRKFGVSARYQIFPWFSRKISFFLMRGIHEKYLKIATLEMITRKK